MNLAVGRPRRRVVRGAVVVVIFPKYLKRLGSQMSVIVVVVVVVRLIVGRPRRRVVRALLETGVSTRGADGGGRVAGGAGLGLGFRVRV